MSELRIRGRRVAGEPFDPCVVDVLLDLQSPASRPARDAVAGGELSATSG